MELNKSFNLTFLGDTHFGENYQHQIAKNGGVNLLDKYGYHYAGEYLNSLMHWPGYTIANLETPFPITKNSQLEGIKKYLHWGDGPKTISQLKKLRINAVSLANNHMLDYGLAGLQDTLTQLESNNLSYFGAGLNSKEAGKPLFIDRPGSQLVIVVTGFQIRKTYQQPYQFYATNHRGGVHLLTSTTISKQLTRLRLAHPKAFIICFPHWGSNYRWRTPQQQQLGYSMIDAGADLIVGHGAHLLQEIEVYNSKWIVYSIGNFIFNSPGRYTAAHYPFCSFIFRLQLRPAGIKIKLYPIVSENLLTHYKPVLLPLDKFAFLKQMLVRRSDSLQKSTVNFLEKSDSAGYRCFELSL